jgi:hypothetical protein
MIRHRRRLATARAAQRAGDFEAARRVLEPIAAGRAPRAVRRAMGRLDLLLGDHEAAEARLHDDPVSLALVHYRAGRYDCARDLRVRGDLPILRLMQAFGAEPYRIDWGGESSAGLPFTQAEAWELPTVAIEVDGRECEAWIDTGGDLLTLPRAFGVAPLAEFRGTFSGCYGRVEAVRLGALTVRDVPVATSEIERAVIGTGFLSRFLPTIDYPGGRLVLRPRDAEPPAGVEVPFALASTHLIVARGSLAGRDLTFLVDSGLRDEHGAAFTAPAATLAATGIPLPETAPETGWTGAGEVTLQLGRFMAPRLTLGPLEQQDVTGLYGAFPPALAKAAGFPIGGLVSHGFLRRYSWTIDFERMRMVFA